MTTNKIKNALSNTGNISIRSNTTEDVYHHMVEVIPYAMVASIRTRKDNSFELLNIKMFSDESNEWESFDNNEIYQMVQCLIKIKDL